MTNSGTAVATRAPKAAPLASLETRKNELQVFLEPGLALDRVIAQVRLQIINTPSLAECTDASLFQAVAQCCSWGAEIGREAYLVPYNTKVKVDGRDTWEKRATAIADYKWLCDLVVQCGGARSIDAKIVYEGCQFEYSEGTQSYVRHVPWSVLGKPRGAVRGAYAVATVGFGQTVQVWIPGDELEKLRERHSQQWKNGEMPYWWAEKTALRRLIKRLPKSARLKERFAKLQQIAADDEAAELAGMEDVTVRNEPAAPAPAAAQSSPPAETPLEEYTGEEDVDQETGEILETPPGPTAETPIDFGTQWKGKTVDQLSRRQIEWAVEVLPEGSKARIPAEWRPVFEAEHVRRANLPAAMANEVKRLGEQKEHTKALSRFVALVNKGGERSEDENDELELLQEQHPDFRADLATKS